MASPSTDRCVYCKGRCGERQQALQCDVCSRWQHRKCRTGISQTFYRRMNKGLEVLDDWRCYVCSLTSTVDAPPDASNTAQGILEETASTSTSTSTSTTSSSDQPRERTPATSFGLRFKALTDPTNGSFSTPVRKLFLSSDSSSDELPTPENGRKARSWSLDEDSSSDDEWMSPPRVDVATPLLIKLERLNIRDSPGDSFRETVKREEGVPSEESVYKLIEGGSDKDKPLLVERSGYSYSKKRVTPNYTYWGCTVRGKEFSCPARVKQVGTTFTALNTTHTHPNKPGIYFTAGLVVQCKKTALAEPTRSVSSIVKEMYSKPEYKDAILPPSSNVVRRINRYRQMNQL